ncbi:Cyst wall-specific glycoprotein Jacob family protein [Entamoeba invadens IP1]|uniref:Cyst wall-specific glycoprotein Jacob family protein n=2 Tax=Entamoeba invadens TaxID=33085 RepID=A0A0A1U115_ENTIV|nr:Cyst wall-specific glycoprotein Jacob family protein [Entamoeba invadens IP1]ABC59320.1 Jacob 5 [Entamoeba invadens]ELP84593.1 Cyst wall-specific glycoprotein Jacob family protein [Entamoeba invadens IP1]|eukprot:XP_004183939.1 Cyst wall-specific glycoprotein Jacob family protein [Entamoeba invadens IP1]
MFALFILVTVTLSDDVHTLKTVNCTEPGMFCVNDGYHSNYFYLCTERFNGYLKCPRNTVCGYQGRIPDTENPCVPVSVKKSETKTDSIPCVSEGLFCIHDGNHEKQFLMCSSTYSNYLNCPTNYSCGYDYKVPDTENPCVEDPKKVENTDICIADGFMCVNDGLHNNQFYMCSSGYKGFMNCPTGAKCSGAILMPFTQSPCVTI